MNPDHPFPEVQVNRTETARSCLGLAFIALAFFLPLVALALGWIGWDWKHGAVAAGITFLVCFLIAGILLATIRKPSWLLAFAPLLAGLAYTVLPDFLPGGIDDAAAMTLGALFTFILGYKKQGGFSGRGFLLLLLAGLFPLIGGFIPGPLDELIATGISFFLVWKIGRRKEESSS